MVLDIRHNLSIRPEDLCLAKRQRQHPGWKLRRAAEQKHMRPARLTEPEVKPSSPFFWHIAWGRGKIGSARVLNLSCLPEFATPLRSDLHPCLAALLTQTSTLAGNNIFPVTTAHSTSPHPLSSSHAKRKATSKQPCCHLSPGARQRTAPTCRHPPPALGGAAGMPCAQHLPAGSA
eukprot:scaffold25027_cov19-Tisochrysis_lutea.AAC.1